MSGTIEWEPGDALIFAQVVDEGSFTAAARSLDLPKSTVSRRVSRLEGQLGLQLLRRTTRQLNLTDAGRAFYAEAARAGEALLAAEQAATSVLDEPRGTLRVTAPAELGTRTFGILLAFNRAYPDLHLDLNLSNQYVDLVEQGYDVALRGGRPPEGTLTGRALVASHIHIVASPEYLKRRGTPKRVSDVAKHDCILFPSWVSGSAWSMTGTRGKVRVPVNGRLTINNLDGVRHAAIEGCGLALLPSGHCETDLEQGALVRVLPGYNRASSGVWIVYPRTRFMSAKVRAFVDYLQAAFENK
ncbi:MAG: DNA-binding transcriptional LysR family regulator [Planctomycetota bacterium]|jgi:DNA-binding transcriptional LysR family regulator